MPALCNECHADVEKATGSAFPHPPAADGECLDCHNAHVGTNPSLLDGSEIEVCSGCHEVDTPEFRTRHGGVQASGNGCTSCHDPHGSDKKGMMLPIAHSPYEDGDCSVCHTEGGALVAGAPGLCVDCHDDHAGDPDRPVPHAAVTEGASCVNCHSPHVGRTSTLLVRDGVKATCTSCHDRRRFEKKVQHPESDCETCHDPHGSGVRGLLREDQQDLCATCHENVGEQHFHPYGPPAVDPRTGQYLQCSSCHDPHSSENESLLLFPQDRTLCIQCHQGHNMEIRKR